MSIDYVVLV